MIILNEIELRVLGSLVEKESTTPDYYPLSLNALLNACNQKSNRDPVLELEESDVRTALESLNEKRLASQMSSADSRVPKFAHRLQEFFNFDRREMAVMCVLMLRGPQTPGELRGRTERMYKFDDLGVVESALHRLMQREPPLVKKLPRQAGTKEFRYAHLLAGDVEGWVGPDETQSGAAPSGPEEQRLMSLESDMQSLREEFAELRKQFEDFRKQFE
jgi:uncharacterized protein YceH (UPF0502 family)